MEGAVRSGVAAAALALRTAGSERGGPRVPGGLERPEEVDA